MTKHTVNYRERRRLQRKLRTIKRINKRLDEFGKVFAAKVDEAERRVKLTRHEQLEALADSGCDTWEEYRSER